ncbi:MAG: CoA transferase [Acidimicrobiales bacterium]|nr:CoA transferase [Acidimicrobiales bacterium]
MAALDGMRVLDLTQYEAGPSATQALAWLGADVVKVERPGVGDPGRGTGPAGSYFHHWNANKRSVCLDLASAEGRALLLDLAPRFDVFAENLGPGVIEKLGLGYDDVRAVHPGVIYASVKGFGASGPYADYKCFDSVAMAMAGAFSVTGEVDGPPLPPGITVGDSGTGTQFALAITAAYVQKLRTGEGQRIELSMQEAVTYYMRTRIAVGGAWGEAAAPRAGRGRGALLDLYPCKPFGPNDYIYLMAVTDPMWKAVPAAIGRPELLDDERFTTNKGRMINAAALHDEIAAFTSTLTKHEAMDRLARAGIPCGAVLDTAELHADPHLVERGFVHDVDIPGHGPAKMLGWPARMSASSVPLQVAPPLGAHTAAVLEAELGLDAAALDALRTTGIVG